MTECLEQAYADTVQRLFLSYLNSPARHADIKNWSAVLFAEGGDVRFVVEAFSLAPNSLAHYAKEGASSYLSRAYFNLFGREAQLYELDFWQQRIESQLTFAHEIPWLLQQNAQFLDAQIWQKRLDAAHDWANNEIKIWMDPLMPTIFESPLFALDTFQFDTPNIVETVTAEHHELIELIGQSWQFDDWLSL